MEQKQLLIEINKVAVRWNKTKDPKDKDLWYKLIKEYNGINNSKRRPVSVDTSVKTNDGTDKSFGSVKYDLRGYLRNTSS